MIEGAATYRERIALPPDAVFEAILDDVTSMDASSTELARTTISGPSEPPIPISIAFDPAAIDPRRSYTVRARILVDGTLWFASDTTHPVLTRGAGHTVDIVLTKVKRDARERPLSGELVYIADAARFTECSTGRDYPVAQEGDFVRMQRAYLKDVKEPGARLYVTFEGLITDRPRMEGSGVEHAVVVERFTRAWPNREC